MKCACKIRKHGTIIYRSDGDLLLSLSKALHKQDITIPTQSTHNDATKSVNALFRQQIHKYLEEDKLVPFKYHQLNIEKSISDMDPAIWSFVCELTKSTSECKGCSKISDTDSHAHHVKKMRRFSCACMLMFCIDDRCCMPLHNLLTDMIDGYGGSSLLIRTLNRLGICSSLDTLARTIQYQVKLRKEIGPEKEFNNTAVCVVSIDNLTLAVQEITAECK